MRFPSHTCVLHPALWIAVAFVGAAVLWPATVQAGESRCAAQTSTGAVTAAPSILLADDDTSWSWAKVFKPLEFVHASRRNMIQLATVGMCIALYIIWWRKFSAK